MRHLLRRLLGIEVRFGKEDALRIAREYSLARNWPWQLPVEVHEQVRTYVMWTNAGSRGGNAIIAVHVTTGEVLSATRTPR